MRHEASEKPAKGWVLPGGDPAGHVSYATIDTQHVRVLKTLNDVAHFRLYDLRHTFLTRLGEAGADPFTIQRIAGHASILVSQRYVHPTPERLEDAFVKLETYNLAKVEELKVKAQQQGTIQ